MAGVSVKVGGAWKSVRSRSGRKEFERMAAGDRQDGFEVMIRGKTFLLRPGAGLEPGFASLVLDELVDAAFKRAAASGAPGWVVDARHRAALVYLASVSGSRSQAVLSVCAGPGLVPQIAGGAGLRVAEALSDAGFEVAAVGGSVRDWLSGGSPKDVDLTTDARPWQIRDALEGVGTVFDVGERFGTVGVDVGGERIEVTTWRSDAYDPSSRKPVVSFGDSLEEDLARRDFTVNAIAVKVGGADGGGLPVVDPFGGLGDLLAGRIRAVGDPDARFSEDPLRIVRAWRFAATRGWSIDGATAEAARRQLRRLEVVSRERITAELVRALEESDDISVAASAAEMLGLGGVVFGRFWSDALPAARLADPGKTAADGGGTVGRLATVAVLAGLAEDQAAAECRRLKLPSTVADGVRRRVLLARSAGGMDDGDLGRWLRADARAHPVDSPLLVRWFLKSSPGGPDSARRVGRLARRPHLLRPMPVDGHDVMNAGFRGPAVGEVIRDLERLWVAADAAPTREALLERVRSLGAGDAGDR